MNKSSFVAFGLLLASSAAFADLNEGSCTDAQKQQVKTGHVLQVGNKALPYTATAGFMEVTAADQSSKACIFYVSYAADNQAQASRPITFAFNGGPGSASLWLHLGLLGPKRVDMGPDGLTPPSGVALVDNPYSPLAFTDVVMIDPVATGFSHAEAGSSNDAFFGVKNDYTSIDAFIENYLITYDRWSSPKYVMGESYGGVRGSLVARHLQEDRGIGLAGLILVSPELSDLTFFSATDNNIPYWTTFPTFATTAWFHGKIADKYRSLDVATVYEQARQFASSELRDALDLGNGMDPATHDAVGVKVADFTGFSLDQVKAFDLKVSDVNIFTDLLHNEGLIVGRYDSRYTERSLPGMQFDDPSDNAVSFPFTAAINQYLRDDLQLNLAVPYEEMAHLKGWPQGDGEMLDVTGDLATALAQNPKLHVMIASGYYDLACPMGGVAYELSQMEGGQPIVSRIQQHKYVGGHMMYINPSAEQQLSGDIRDFVGNPL